MFPIERLLNFDLHLRPAPNPVPHTPSVQFIKERIIQSLNEENIIKDFRDFVDGSRPPHIGKIALTVAALRLIRDVWQCKWARHASHPPKATRFAPPKIPLKYFPMAWHDGKIDIEVHPGLDSWEEILNDRLPPPEGGKWKGKSQ